MELGTDPETAVALSPIYPTPKYQMPDPSVDIVARAREASKAVAKEPQTKSLRKAKEPLQEIGVIEDDVGRNWR